MTRNLIKAGVTQPFLVEGREWFSISSLMQKAERNLKSFMKLYSLKFVSKYVESLFNML